MNRRTVIGWGLLAAVVAVAVGTAVTGPGPRAADPLQRAAQIERAVRCPDINSCGGTVSIAQSRSPVAVEMRKVIEAKAKSGKSNAEIESYLVGRYGSAILLSPPSVAGTVLGLLPFVALALFMAAGLVVWRSRRRRTGLDTTVETVPDANRAVETRRDGDPLSENPSPSKPAVDDISSRDATGGAPRPGRKLSAVRRKWLVVAGTGLVSVAAAAGGLLAGVVSSGGPRRLGAPATGSAERYVSGAMAQAAAQERQGHLLQALQLYRKVLSVDRTESDALAEYGWITYESGVASHNAALVAEGSAYVKRAVTLAPKSYAPHLYLGTIYLDGGGSAAEAVRQYREFLAGKPPVQLVREATPFMKRAAQRAREPISGMPATAP